ncbi:MAG: serine hydrolase [Armatimonadetes bacterium]|nr:serine hydrolase [Armatimonadota bacterium]
MIGLLYFANMPASAGKSARIVFPKDRWEESPPEAQGVSSEKVKEAIAYLASSLRGYGGADTVAIVRNGYLIHRGAACGREFTIFSATKSFTSTVLGLLVEDKKIRLGDYAKKYAPHLAHYYPHVRIRHFATMTSGYDAAGEGYETDEAGRSDSWNPEPPAPPIFPPGTKFRYWDDAMMQFGSILTKAAGEPLDAIFKRRIADPIGMKVWRWEEVMLPQGRVLGWTGSIVTSALEMARFGHLFLNKGKWDGRQLVRASWVKAATSV